MTAGLPPDARAALDAARASVSAPGNGGSAAAPDAGAAITAAWRAAEDALRALLAAGRGGSPHEPAGMLSGQALVRELRRRELITLDQAHLLLAFRDAADRAAHGAAAGAVAPVDLEVARTALDSLEQAPAAPPAPAATGRGQGSAIAVVAILLLVLVGGGVALFFRFARTDDQERGIALYQDGKRAEARGTLERAVASDSTRAVARVYLARIARDEGDEVRAQRELAAAIRTAPSLGIAHREMGSLLFARGDYTIARRFYSRATALDPADASARGLLGCAEIRLGDLGAGIGHVNGAGPGPWTSCLPAPASPR